MVIDGNEPVIPLELSLLPSESLGLQPIINCKHILKACSVHAVIFPNWGKSFPITPRERPKIRKVNLQPYENWVQALQHERYKLVRCETF